MSNSLAPRILAVDDVEMNLEILRDLAAGLNLSIDTASDAASAITLAAKHEYALLLLDLQLPDFNGDELLARIRGGTGKSARTPAFLITGELDHASIPALKAAGFARVYAKPYDFKQLKQAVADMTGAQANTAVITGTSVTEANLDVNQLFDRARAMSAIGHSETFMLKMRELFGKELSERWAEIQRTRDDRALHREALHKLSGSCAMVAAVALENAIAHYREQFDSAGLVAAWQELEACVANYTRALGR